MSKQLVSIAVFSHNTMVEVAPKICDTTV